MCNKTSSEKVLVEHKGICLQMNRKQAVKLGKVVQLNLKVISNN